MMMANTSRLIASIAFATASAAIAQASDPVPIGDVGEWFGPDQYPAEALRRMEQGRVTARLLVDASGKPTACDVGTSSGSAALDKATCAILLTKASYQPARDRGGRAVNGTVTVPVRWALPESTQGGTLDVALPHRFPDTDTMVDIDVAPDGTVASCAVTPPQPLPSGQESPCSQWPVGKKVMPALMRAGRPIHAHLEQHFTFTTRFDP